jgi:hypothetical protein
MARGIISTILGGVAGGLEGLGVQQQRRREEADQLRREQLEDERWREAQRLNLQTQGYRPVASALEQASKTTQEGQRLEGAGNIMLPGGGVVRMSPIGSALRAAGEQQGANIDRGYRVSLGGQEFVRPFDTTPEGIAEANRLQAIEDLKESRRFTREELDRENLGYYNLMRQQGYDVGEFDPTVPYASYYDVVSRERLAVAGRTPARPEQPEPTDVDRGIDAIRKFLVDSYAEGVPSPELYGSAINIGRAFNVPEDVVRGMLLAAGEDQGDGGGGDETGPYLAPGILVQQRRESAAQIRTEQENADVARFEENLRQYDAALALNPNDRELRGIRARTIISLNRLRPNQYPVDARTIREAELGPF